MSRSGSYNFTLTKNNLITHALRTCNLIADDETPTNEMMQYASDSLNLMIKAWQAEGIQLWNRRRGFLFTAYQDGEYTISSTGDNCTNSYVATALNGALAASATAVTVDSTTGMTVGDYIGVKLSSGARYWTTIATIPTSTTLTLTVGVTTAASDNASVVSYTTKMTHPLRIIQATLYNLTDEIDRQLMPIGYDTYYNLPNKAIDGVPNQYFYDKKLDAGTLLFYPRPENVDYVLHFTYHEPMEDFDSATNDADFPIEWLDAVILNLVVKLAVRYGKFPELQVYQPMAAEAKQIAQRFDNDEEDIHITVEIPSWN